MALLVEFDVSSPLFGEVTSEVPEMVFTIEDILTPPSDLPRLVFWATGGSFDTLDDALATDETVASYKRLTVVRDRALYRATLVEDTDGTMLHHAASKYDIVFLRASVSDSESGEVRIQAHVPSRDELASFYEDCLALGRTFTLASVYPDSDPCIERRYGLSDAQQSALLHAFNNGYFDESEGPTIEEMADELGVSVETFSDRLARGQQSLVKNTLAKYQLADEWTEAHPT